MPSQKLTPLKFVGDFFWTPKNHHFFLHHFFFTGKKSLKLFVHFKNSDSKMTHFWPLFFKNDPFFGSKNDTFLASLGIFCHFPALFGRLSERSDLDRIFRFEKKSKKLKIPEKCGQKVKFFMKKWQKMTKKWQKMAKNVIFHEKYDFFWVVLLLH